jgi:hypothetical protein
MPAQGSAISASPHEQSSGVKVVGAVAQRNSEPEDEAVLATRPSLEDGAPPPVDEAAESAFLAEAKERGEVVVPKPPSEAEETHAKTPLPALDDLVSRIPADVREVLEDLFRARFVTVKRFPKKALKTEE